MAARAGAAARDRRSRLLAVLGAGIRSRTAFTIGEAALPICVGTLASLALFVPAMLTDLPLPLVDFVLYHPDAIAAMPLLGLTLSTVPLLVLMACVLLGPRADGAQRTGTRPTARPGRAYRLSVLAFAPLLLLVVRGTEVVPDDLKLPYYVAGTALVFATLPAVVGVACAKVGTLLSSLGQPFLGLRIVRGQHTAADTVQGRHGPRGVLAEEAAPELGLGGQTDRQYQRGDESDRGLWARRQPASRDECRWTPYARRMSGPRSCGWRPLTRR
ncbi:hypothetical protein AAH978_19445 [Streptomyces sp. ZYX-F-203]